MADLLEKGELDLAILSEYAVPEHLRSRTLFAERYVCALRQNHPALAKMWNIETFCALDFVLVSFFGGSFVGATDVALEKLGYRRNVAMSVQSFLLVPDLLRRSDYAAVMPEHLLLETDGLAVKEVPFEVADYQKMMVWHERSQQDVVHRWLREVVEQAI